MPKINIPAPPSSARIASRQELGRVIRYVRMQAGLTVDEAALSIGVAKATLLRAEQGKAGLQFDNVMKILDGLGISLFALPATPGREGDLAWPKH